MSADVMERGNTALDIPINPETGEYDEYYWEDYDLYHSEKFAAEMKEVMDEIEDMRAHPEKYKTYDSFKEMLRDSGFDVSDLPDD